LSPTTEGLSDSVVGDNIGNLIVLPSWVTIRFPNPKIKRNDTVKLNLKSNEIIGHYKFAIGAHCMITSGNNIGRVGTIIREEKHPGSYEIIHIKDNNGVEFSTRLKNVFVTGSNQHEVQLLKRHSKISIIN